MGHQPRPGYDIPCRTAGLVCWWVILSVLGIELGSPPFRWLVALSLIFLTGPISLKTES